jgi:hypothetical protein
MSNNLSANIFQLLLNNQECIYIGYTLKDIEYALTLLKYTSNNKNLRRNKRRRPLLATITDWTNVSIHLISKVKFTTKSDMMRICREIKKHYNPTMNKQRSRKKTTTDRRAYFQDYYNSVRCKNKKQKKNATASHTQEQYADYISRRRQELSRCSNPFL